MNQEKKQSLFLLLFLLFAALNAQNSNRIFKSVKEKSNHLEIVVNDGVYTLKPYSNNIIETTFVPNGESIKKESHAVILQPKKVKTKLQKGENILWYETKGLKVKIQKQPFQISYYQDDELIISEKLGYKKTDSTEIIEFNLTKNEALYGAGARALGMNRRGYKLPLYNRAHYGYQTHSEQMNFSMPIVLSSKQYLIHFDNAPIGFLDFDSKKDNTLSYETTSGRKTYQVVVGDSWIDLTHNYTDLTGKQPMLPRWALGNFSSRFGYHSQDEVEETIQKFKDDKIPVDGVILDLYWFGKEIKGTMGNLKADKDSFPDLLGMIDRLNQKNVKTILITEPFILSTSNRWNEAVKEDILAKDSVGKPAQYEFYFGNTGIIDIYKPEGEQWFWNIYKGLANQGVAGFWGDLGEPEVHPEWVQHHTGTANEVHNIYGHDWARLVYEGYKKDFPNQRPFILMRAGYSGSQRFGMIPWSGDVSRSWGGLQSQPEIALQMGMQGMAYMHSDLGGFAGANLDDELYVRWLQYGVFQPVFRPHAQEDVPSEPVFRSEKAKQHAKQAIELRYKMLPYNYNLMYENHTKGTPLMRPLLFEEPKNEDLKTLANNYLWGHDFLVAPVLDSAQKEVNVYFPKTANWFDFYTSKKYAGGQTKTILTKEKSIPTFVRGGAIIPMSKPIQNTEEFGLDDLEIHYYFDDEVTQSEQKIYHDDGKSKNPSPMSYKVKIKQNEKQIKIKLNQKSEIPTENPTNEFVVHHINKEPKQVKVGNKKVNFEYNTKNKTLRFPFQWKSKTIKIKL